jgi:Icc-related predicted phosphoesterase
MADIKEIIKSISGNKELMAQVANADPKQGVELLKKANINVSEDDIKKVQAALADGKLDINDIKDLAGGFFNK